MYFPLKPRHRIHEPAHGYVLRLVETNGYDWRGCKLQEVGAGLAGLASGRGLEFAVVHGRADPKLLTYSTPALSSPGRFRLCGQTLHRSQLTFGRKRFCAGCWSDDLSSQSVGIDVGGRPYLRCWWSIGPLAICPIHCIGLSDRCSACGRATTFESGGLTSCSCGADLTRQIGPVIERPRIAPEGYMLSRLGVSPPHEVPSLDGLELGDAILLLQRLGSIARPESGVRLCDVTQQDRDPLASAGMELCLRGDEAVEEALGRYLDATGRTDAFKTALGPFYAWVGDLPDCPSRLWVMDRLAAVFSNRHIRWESRRGDGSHPSTEKRVHLRAAAKLLDLSHTPARRILEFSGLLPSDGPRHIRHTVDRDGIEELRRRLDRLIDVQTTATRIGVDEKSVLALAAAGIFPPSVLGRHAFGNAMTFDPDGVDEVLARIRGSAASADRLPPRTKRLPDASRSCGMVELCRRILAGSIVPIAVIDGEPGLMAIVLEADAVRSFENAAMRSHITVATARRRLRLREATMTGLLAEGYIRAVPSRGGRKLLSLEDVAAFENRYVSSSELALRWRTNTGNVLKAMRSAGLPAIIEFERGDRIELRFFDRAKAADVTPVRPRDLSDRSKKAVRILRSQ